MGMNVLMKSMYFVFFQNLKPPVTQKKETAPIVNITNIVNHVSLSESSASNFQLKIETSLPSTSTGSVKSDEFAKNFCEWFYKMINKLQPICSQQEGDVFSEKLFLNNSSVEIFMITSQTVERKGSGQAGSYFLLKNTLQEFELLFSPNIETGLQVIKGEHGIIKVFCCGSLQKLNTFLGIYEQEFGLIFCPMEKVWKILYTKLNLKHATVTQQLPSLPPCEIFEIKPDL